MARAAGSSPKKIYSLRPCRYCKAKFMPVRADQRFCSGNHRKAFFRYGGLPFDRMRDQILKQVLKVVREEFAVLSAQLKSGAD